MRLQSSIRNPRSSILLRRCTELIVIGLIAALLVIGWGRTGTLRPIRVVGPSMAPTLRGSHLELVCVDCGCPFACAAEEDDSPMRPAICPNCGYPQPESNATTLRDGDRMLVDTLAYRLAKPRRWDVVVFQSPEAPGTYVVKRAVGLPGETVAIRDGDVWINGARARKSLDQQRSLAVAVYDSRYRPHVVTQPPPRWRPARSGSGWIASGSGFRYTPPTAGGDSTDWLEYAHWRRLPRQEDGVESAPISDDDPYDRTSSRRLNEVADLLLIARLQVAGAGKLSMRADVRGAQYTVEIEPRRGRGALLRRGQDDPLATFDLSRDAAAPLLARAAEVEFSLVDHQVLLSIDGRLVIDYNVPAAGVAAPVHESSRPLAIGARGIQVDIEQLRLLRDVYYTEPGGPGGRFGIGRPLKLGFDEYFVLGDNSPVSADSRSGFPGGGLSAKFLVGPPVSGR